MNDVQIIVLLFKQICHRHRVYSSNSCKITIQTVCMYVYIRSTPVAPTRMVPICKVDIKFHSDFISEKISMFFELQ